VCQVCTGRFRYWVHLCEEIVKRRQWLSLSGAQLDTRAALNAHVGVSLQPEAHAHQPESGTGVARARIGANITECH